MKHELGKLLCEGLLIDMSKVGNLYNLLVKEPKNSGEGDLSKFTIEGLPSDAVAFSLDHTHSDFLKQKFKNKAIKNFSWLINDKLKKVNKNCDIVIIVPHIGKHFVIVGEMKSNSKKLRGDNVRDQLLNSHLFLKYLFDLLENHKFVPDGINPVFGYVVFSNKEGVERLNEKYNAQEMSNQKITYINVLDGGKKHFNYILDRVFFK